MTAIDFPNLMSFQGSLNHALEVKLRCERRWVEGGYEGNQSREISRSTQKRIVKTYA